MRRGARVTSADSTPFAGVAHLFRPLNDSTTVTAFFNRYNLPSMVQDLQVLVDGFPAGNPNWLLYENGEKWCDLHYATNFHDVSLEECRQRRIIIFNHLSRALREANTYVLTLGLCESWFDLEAQSYLNIAPWPRVTAANPNRFEFRFLDYEDNLRMFDSIYGTLCDLKGTEEFEIILTVSPVPIQTTFTSADIVVANTEAKAILRAVAGEAARRFPRITYFPSYEIVTHSNTATSWDGDRVHVQQPLTAHVIASFFELMGASCPTGDVLRP